jgi:diguanylate cyclase (GGDEF)-like protein/putative nucleotidyltransferase with HDIG domain
MVNGTRLSPRFGQVYVPTVIATGLVVVSSCVYELWSGPVPHQWFLLAALTLVSGSATVRLPSSHASISISEVFVFIAILLYGPAAGTVVVALDGLVISFWLAKRIRDPRRAFFNMSAPAISAWCSAHSFFLTSGLPPLALQPATMNRVLPSLAIAAFVYWALNTWLITLAIASDKKVNPIKLWSSSFVWLALNYFFGASVAVLVVSYNRVLDVGFIGVIVPLLLVLYFTFRSTIARIDDADRHVVELNTLYLSTIETLAMAIDAKDQVTHGHIRRVQTYAVGLARYVGVEAQGQIQAIEAAALLHDMGKLAVPEYILNKPGKLTPAEFEKMKLHASVGADILSEIEFPYPVVPLVRYHHECWDGSGYPEGIRGTDIPIGARILAVVDCFDALTSDRPYRPRLSDDEALKILKQRRGSMYDPLIVDTFVKVHKEIAPDPISANNETNAVEGVRKGFQDLPSGAGTPRLDEIAASSDEMVTLFALARSLAGQSSLVDAGSIVAQHLRRLVPSSLYVFFLYDRKADDLEAAIVFGEASSLVTGLRIPLGQRLSGWVAANQQTIVNSDPSLDLGDIARAISPRLRSCLSTPLLVDSQLVGTLSLYSEIADSFNEGHRRIIETVAKQVGHAFDRPSDTHAVSHRDPVTGLPNVTQLEQLLKSDAPSADEPTGLVLLLVDVFDMERINARHGRTAGDEALNHAVRQARLDLPMGHLLFRCDSDEFVVVLTETDQKAAEAIATAMRNRVRSNSFTLKNGKTLSIDISVTRVDGSPRASSLTSLIAVARRRLESQTPASSRVH